MTWLTESLGNQDAVDRVPIDVAARVVVELVAARMKDPRAQGQARLDVLHIVAWRELVPAIRKYFGEHRIKAVSFKAWLERLRRMPLTAEEVERKPGVKLLDFYAGPAGGERIAEAGDDADGAG